RVSRGPAPDARRRHGRGDCAAPRRAGCGGRRGRPERGVRPRARRRSALLRAERSARGSERVRLRVAPRPDAVQRPVRSAVAGGRQGGRVAPRGPAHRPRAGSRAALPRDRGAAGAVALGCRGRRRVGAALVRGREEPQRVRWTLPAACGWAALAAVAGLWLWQPYGAWPEWYTFVWLPALLGAIVPAPRRWAVAGIAVVAGTAAALV